MKQFKFPAPLKHRFAAKDLLDAKSKKHKTDVLRKCTCRHNRTQIKSAMREAKKAGYDPDKDVIFADIESSAGFGQWTKDIMPTLTRSRGGDCGFYVSTRRRKISVDEMLRFQGFRPDTVEWREAKMSRCEVGRALGNAMSCTVLERLLPRVLVTGGLLAKWTDKYEKPEAAKRSNNPLLTASP